jgi:glycolate oxidase FAD binding subunit
VITTAVATRVSRELAGICGAEHVNESPTERILGCAPSVAVRPGSPQEIAAILRFANQNGLVVVPAGGLTQQNTGKSPSQVDILLYTTRLTETEHYDPGDLTVGIGAGCVVSELCHRIAKDDLLFAADPPLWERATVGGTLATGITGPRRYGYGGLRDYCIGIKFVTGDGRLGKGGGRVVKNVAGYDMMKLLIGSRGTLAIITGASFKLFPAPRNLRTFVACFPNAVEALQYRDRVMRSPLGPMSLELASPAANTLITPGSPADSFWTICVRGTGSDAVLARYRAELGSAVVHEMDGDKEAGFWRMLADFPALACKQDPDSLVLSTVSPLRDVRRVLDVMHEVSAANGFNVAAVGRVAVGHLMTSLTPAVGRQIAKANYVDTMAALDANLPRDTSIAVFQCPDEARDEIPVVRTPTHLGSMHAVKQALDPNNILNRGRFLF